MPGFHNSFAIHGEGVQTILHNSEAPDCYREFEKDEPYYGMVDLPADNYAIKGQVHMSIQELLASFGDKDYVYGRVYNNYQHGLDLHLFKRGSHVGGYYRLKMPAVMPDYLPPLRDGENYPRPTDWWAATGKDYVHDIPADYGARSVRPMDLRLTVMGAQPIADGNATAPIIEIDDGGAIEIEAPIDEVVAEDEPMTGEAEE